MWYPTYYPLVSNSLGKKSRTILLSVTLFFLLIPCSRKVRCIVGSSIKYVWSDGGEVNQLKAFWLILGAWGAGGWAVRVSTPWLLLLLLLLLCIISRVCCKTEILAIQAAEKFHSHVFRTVKKHTLDPSAFLDVLIRRFMIAFTVSSLFLKVTSATKR